MIDLVCGMEISEADAAATAECQGTTYYFCSEECGSTFGEDPAAYV
jgi:Uncharacterized conserved protein